MACWICGETLDEEHHIKPRSQGGGNEESNLVRLCPNHHSSVYIEGCKGKHGVKRKNHLIIDRWFSSSKGRVLHYFTEDGEFFD